MNEPAVRRTPLSAHLKVALIAVAFGLAAYAVVRAAIALTDRLGWLDWLRGGTHG